MSVTPPFQFVMKMLYRVRTPSVLINVHAKPPLVLMENVAVVSKTNRIRETE